MNKKETKILLFDIETSPNLGWVWGKYEQNVIEYDKEWYVLCYAYKWLNKKSTKVVGLPDFKSYQKDKENDKELVFELWKLFDEADIIIAHNGDRFDIRKMNARFIAHGLNPPSPYKTIDTKKVAKRYFAFNSNKLNDISQHLGIGKKVDTGGFELWKGCMNGDAKSWRDMMKYNKQDVVLLEEVYLEMRKWIHNHHNINAHPEHAHRCPKCGSKRIQKRGWGVTTVSKYQRYHCQDCGGWSKGKTVRIEDMEIR